MNCIAVESNGALNEEIQLHDDKFSNCADKKEKVESQQPSEELFVLKRSQSEGAKKLEHILMFTEKQAQILF